MAAGKKKKGSEQESGGPVFEFVSELRGIRPRIWRRFQISGNTSLARLAYAVMPMYRMTGSHLFALMVGGCTYEVPFNGSPVEEEDAREVTLLELAAGAPGLRIDMIYDFGDSWEVRMDLKKILPEGSVSERLPRVLRGAGYGIVEDCGGIYGLAELAEAAAEKSGPMYEDYNEMLDLDNFDLKEFNLDEINRQLEGWPGTYECNYESGFLF